MYCPRQRNKLYAIKLVTLVIVCISLSHKFTYHLFGFWPIISDTPLLVYSSVYLCYLPYLMVSSFCLSTTIFCHLCSIIPQTFPSHKILSLEKEEQAHADSQSREPGSGSPLVPFRSLGIFVISTMSQFIQLYE